MNRISFIIIGFIYIVYIIYIRLFLIRFPKDLYMLNPTKYGLIIAMCLTIIISSIIIVNNVLILTNKKNYEKVGIFQKSLGKINIFIGKVLLYTYDFIINMIPGDYDKISAFATKFYQFFGYRTESLLVEISCICRLIIVFTFMYDVFIHFTLNYFYKSLILLCIPLLINIVIYILKDFSNNVDDMAQYLILEESIDQNNIPFTKFQPSPGNEDIDLDYHVKQFLICNKIKGFLDIYDIYSYQINIRVNIFIYSLFLISWIYVIYINYIFYYSV